MAGKRRPSLILAFPFYQSLGPSLRCCLSFAIAAAPTSTTYRHSRLNEECLPEPTRLLLHQTT